MTNMLLTLAILLPAAPAPAPKDTKPKGPPPQVVMISGGSGMLEILQTQTVQKSVPQQRTRQVQVGQQTRTVTETVMVSVSFPVQQVIRVSLDDNGVQVYGADGKKIDPKDVGKRVAKPVAALLSADGKPVDPFYLRLAREGTLVFVVPAAATLRQDFSDPTRPKDAAPKPLEVKPVPVRKR